MYHILCIIILVKIRLRQFLIETQHFKAPQASYCRHRPSKLIAISLRRVGGREVWVSSTLPWITHRLRMPKWIQLLLYSISYFELRKLTTDVLPVKRMQQCVQICCNVCQFRLALPLRVSTSRHILRTSKQSEWGSHTHTIATSSLKKLQILGCHDVFVWVPILPF